MRKYTKRVVPADRSPESIADVVCIVIAKDNDGIGHVKVDIVSLDGTVEEKLAQYKAATGKDWSGFDEQVFSTPVHQEPVSLDLGKTNFKREKSKEDQEIQEKIDALTAQAQKWVLEARLAKSKKKLLAKRKEMQASGQLA